MHNAIQLAYSKLSDKEQYREKPLGSYYRVSFNGKVIKLIIFFKTQLKFLLKKGI
jgi:hypothetical protein